MEQLAEKKLIFGTGLSSSKDKDILHACCTTAVESNILGFDTAPSYQSEELLGHVLSLVLKEQQLERSRLHIQTKIDPIQMYNGNVIEHVDKTLIKMGLDYFDCLLVHWPVYKYFRKTWEDLETVKQKKKTRLIGICNLRIEHLEELKSVGVLPDVLQIERHPLNSFEAEREFCEINHIHLQDYSPLCKMHPLLKNNRHLLDIATHHHCGVGEIIRKWHIQTGAIPIFTSTKESRIRQYSRLDDILLSNEEMDTVSSLNINYKLYLESLICPGF